jgi:hypothetical protein
MNRAWIGAITALSVVHAAHAVEASPLDFSNTILTKTFDHLPKGLKWDRNCGPHPEQDCGYGGPGIAYVVFGGRISHIELSRVSGRFRYPLPYGLTGNEDGAGVRAALERRGIVVHPVNGRSGVMTSGFVHLLGEDCWIDFDFGKDGRLKKASIGFDDGTS